MKPDIKSGIIRKWNELKNYVGKLNKKTKILTIVIAILIIVGAVTTALILNHKEYVPLFSEVSEDEAAEIVNRLQEEGVDYEYKGDGTILVEESQADATRASLVYEGYPSSGFTYDIFTENAGGMATDSEKQTYKLYELQNRIGATIALFDGVKDAKVTIALDEERQYVLEDQDSEETQGGSASVVVTMKSGEELEEKQAKAIQRLVAKSVPNMEMENVAVFDQNGIELSEDASSQSVSTTEMEISQIIERKIEQSVVNVLEPFYGAENIKVSANGKVNMDQIVRETTTYTTPDKVDENDKTGIVSQESGTETSGNGNESAGGVAGTEENADITEYNQGDDSDSSAYSSNSYDREYLVNQVKEQTQIDPGVMEDLSVAISINGEGVGNLNMNQIRELAANATGISLEEMEQKITVVAAPFYLEENDTISVSTDVAEFILKNRRIAAAAGGGLLLLFVFLFILRRIFRRRRGREDVMEDESFEMMSSDIMEENKGVDIVNIQNERSRQLRNNVRDFAETNPEISAQMLRAWLNGGEDNGGVTD